MGEPYFSKELSERQTAVVMHYLKNLIADPNDLEYVKTQEYKTDVFPVDIVIVKPTEYFNYYVVATVGLSSYRFDSNFARCELMMVLPPEWKPILDKEEFYWPPQLLRDIAYNLIDNDMGVAVGQVHVLTGTEDSGTYSPFTDAVGGIITMPEMFPVTMCEEKIGDTYTRFMQVVPVTKDDVAKIESMTPFKFIEFELHDSEGPQMVVELKEKPLQGIDKIIKQNEAVLKGKNKKD
ncbi:MAG: suppressor of fused domain protein [Clostridia bacterium]|nr:suppressor of fused domain protein [Clostridia bacterium]